MFAVSDVVWQAAAVVTGGLVSVTGIVVGALVTIKLAQIKAGQDMAAVAVKEVKTTLKEESAKQDAKLTLVSEQVEEVHKATNSMKDALVLTTEKEAHARGIVEGKAASKE